MENSDIQNIVATLALHRNIEFKFQRIQNEVSFLKIGWQVIFSLNKVNIAQICNSKQILEKPSSANLSLSIYTFGDIKILDIRIKNSGIKASSMHNIWKQTFKSRKSLSSLSQTKHKSGASFKKNVPNFWGSWD